MKYLKHLIAVFIVAILVWSCSSSPVKNSPQVKEEPVVIANDSLEYQITIIDVGFNTFLESVARPKGFYSQNYMETRNRIFVTNWNMRARNPAQFNPNIYENVIDYQPTVNYGYEVNYKLFNYFLFAQQKYKINLGVGRPNRIR